MEIFAHLGTAVLLLSFGSVIPAFAQQEQAKPEQKPAQQHAQQQPQQHAQQPQAQPQQHAQQPQAQQQNQQKAQQQQAQQHNQQSQQQNQQKQQAAQQQNQQKAQQQQAQQHNQQAQQQQHAQQAQQAQHQNQQNQQHQQQAQHSPEQQHAQQAAWQNHQSQNWNSDHRTWQQRGGYHGYRIPDNRYNGYFGPNYGFVIYNQPYMVVGGFPRFQYNGFWFSVVDPWPNTWANNWYQTDDVYIVYQDNGYYMYNQRYPGVGIAISVSM